MAVQRFFFYVSGKEYDRHTCLMSCGLRFDIGWAIETPQAYSTVLIFLIRTENPKANERPDLRNATFIIEHRAARQVAIERGFFRPCPRTPTLILIACQLAFPLTLLGNCSSVESLILRSCNRNIVTVTITIIAAADFRISEFSRGTVF